jgi:hypothetical protein
VWSLVAAAGSIGSETAAFVETTDRHQIAAAASTESFVVVDLMMRMDCFTASEFDLTSFAFCPIDF